MGWSYRATGLLLHQEGQGNVFKMRDWPEVCLSAGFHHWPTVGMFLSAQRPFLCSGGVFNDPSNKNCKINQRNVGEVFSRVPFGYRTWKHWHGPPIS